MSLSPSPSPSSSSSSDAPSDAPKQPTVREIAAEILGENYEVRKRGNIVRIETRKPYRCVKRAQCELCGKQFRSPSELETHKASHSKDRNFACQDGYAGKTPKAKKTPVKECHELKPYMCSQCHKRFARSDILVNHVRTIHKRKEDPEVICECCKKTFVDQKKLNRHLKESTKCPKSNNYWKRDNIE